VSPADRLVVRNPDGSTQVDRSQQARDPSRVDLVSVPRPNARDENVVQVNPDKTATMKAAGAGVTPVAILDTQKG
jgi:hypothetical protein